MKNSLRVVVTFACLALVGCEGLEKYYLSEFNLIIQPTTQSGRVTELKCAGKELSAEVTTARLLMATSNPNGSGLAWALKGGQDSCSGEFNLLYVDSMDLEKGWAIVKLAKAFQTQPEILKTAKGSPSDYQPLRIENQRTFKFMCGYQKAKYDGIKHNLITCANAEGSWLTLSSQPNARFN